MNKHVLTARILLLTFTLLLPSSSLFAQHRREATPRKPAPAPAPVAAPAKEAEPAPTFDTLVGADTYKIYVEVRAVGQLVHSPAFNDSIEPALKLLGGDKELKVILNWLNAHADTLAGSRALVAAWPSKKNLPDAVVAIEFSSPEEAQKFEPDLRTFILGLTNPPQAGSSTTAAAANSPRPSFRIMHAGSLVLISEKPFSFQALKPLKARLLAEDPGFVTAHNRFASESLFLYVDLKAIQKEEEEQRQRWQDEERRRLEEEASRPRPSPEVEEPEVMETERMPAVAVTPPPDEPATLVSPSTKEQDGDIREAQALNSVTTSIYAALFSGQPTWPDAIAAAANFEDDTYVVRALILSGDSKVLPVPFFPHFVSGPAVTLQSAAVVPADADLLVAASLDYPQIYESIVRTISFNSARDVSLPGINSPPYASPFTEYEQVLGMKVKDDILPMLGNELAMAFLPKSIEPAGPVSPAANVQPKTTPADPDPIVAIAVRDKEGVRRLIPKLIDSLAVKGASALAQTERRDDTEIVSYANILAYAFIGDFLVVSPNADVTRRAVTAYLSGETLAGNTHYRNAKRWQSREVLGQVYVAPAMMQKYLFGTRANNNALAEFSSRLATVEPLTYSLSNEGSGPIHELHVPKSLLSFVVASALNDAHSSSVLANEAAAKSALRNLVSAEETYRASVGDGRYGTLEQLATENLISNEMLQRYGYRIDLTASANKFEATAVPLEYQKTGRLSFFVDESALLRAGDHGGGAATISDPPIE